MQGTNRWFGRLLSICPALIAVLWLAGVTCFRNYSLSPREWSVIVCSALALHVLSNRIWRPRPLPPLPEGANPAVLAALAATIIALLAAIIGGVLESVVQAYEPSETSWELRTAWHAACAFGAAYCGFLFRLVSTGRPPAKRS